MEFGYSSRHRRAAVGPCAYYASGANLPIVIQKPLTSEAVGIATMSIRVERAEFDPVDGFLYYVIFKPNLGVGVEDVQMRTEVGAVISLTETGELADLSFLVPKSLRNDQALSFICGEGRGSYVEPNVFVVLPGPSGDTVASVPGRLEVDMAGRIVGMVIQWQPTDETLA
jgi:hypothetical protein